MNQPPRKLIIVEYRQVAIDMFQNTNQVFNLNFSIINFYKTLKKNCREFFSHAMRAISPQSAEITIWGDDNDFDKIENSMVKHDTKGMVWGVFSKAHGYKFSFVSIFSQFIDLFLSVDILLVSQIFIVWVIWKPLWSSRMVHDVAHPTRQWQELTKCSREDYIPAK